jgi:hypothetical protein
VRVLVSRLTERIGAILAPAAGFEQAVSRMLA